MRIYKGTYGFSVIIDCGIDLSTATNTKIYYQKPSGEEGSWTATVETIDGDTQYLKYTIVSGDLDEAGDWKLQPYAEIGTWAGRGTSVTMRITEWYE